MEIGESHSVCFTASEQQVLCMCWSLFRKQRWKWAQHRAGEIWEAFRGWPAVLLGLCTGALGWKERQEVWLKNRGDRRTQGRARRPRHQFSGERLFPGWSALRGGWGPGPGALRPPVPSQAGADEGGRGGRWRGRSSSAKPRPARQGTSGPGLLSPGSST